MLVFLPYFSIFKTDFGSKMKKNQDLVVCEKLGIFKFDLLSFIYLFFIKNTVIFETF